MGLLEEHLKKYPLMQIEDKIKLLMQSIMGPGHLISDRKQVFERLTLEYEKTVDIDYNYDLVEDIGDDFVRIYIKPYFEANKSFDKLVEAFILSCNESNDLYFLEKELLHLMEKSTDVDKKKIDEYFCSGNILISHSEIYRNNYHPHYMVISKKYLFLL